MEANALERTTTRGSARAPRPPRKASCRTKRPSKRKTKRARALQGELFARTWGGKRRGAGRKRRGPRELVEHRPRETFRGRCPVHVTLRLADGLPSLRKRATYARVVGALGGGCERFGMRLVHWSVLSNHLHLIVEAISLEALSRGMQGLGVRLARALNRWWRRTGRVFADRFHSHVLRSPSEVRRALFYVLHNAKRHGIDTAGADLCSSGPWFDGWLAGGGVDPAALERPSWLRAAGTWLLARGWRRLGLLDVSARPAGP